LWLVVVVVVVVVVAVAVAVARAGWTKSFALGRSRSSPSRAKCTLRARRLCCNSLHEQHCKEERPQIREKSVAVTANLVSSSSSTITTTA
jgi:hypothetical protein